MHRAFLTGTPKHDELKLLKKFIGTYRDGTGGNREQDGSSRADSRQLERCFAEMLHGTTSENKAFYDFLVEFNEGGGIAVRGASLKSKEIADIASYKPNSTTMRAHLELSNSSAKDWKACREVGLTEADFLSHMHANKFGEVILERQTTQRLESEAAYLKKRKGTSLSFIQDECVYISVLYSPANKGERQWMVSTFKASLPQPASWGFQGKALVGYETNGDRLYEWYALSGSQLKYYPKLSSRLYGTDLFTVPKPSVETLRAKSERLFGA